MARSKNTAKFQTQQPFSGLFMLTDGKIYSQFAGKDSEPNSSRCLDLKERVGRIWCRGTDSEQGSECFQTTNVPAIHFFLWKRLPFSFCLKVSKNTIRPGTCAPQGQCEGLCCGTQGPFHQSLKRRDARNPQEIAAAKWKLVPQALQESCRHFFHKQKPDSPRPPWECGQLGLESSELFWGRHITATGILKGRFCESYQLSNLVLEV